MADQQQQHLPTFHFSALDSPPALFDPTSPSLEQQQDAPTAKQQQKPDLPPLFLSIDAGVSKLRACVLSDALEVVWVAEVAVSDELPSYGTYNGVHIAGDVVTCSSEQRVAALDLLLDKLARDCPDPTLLSRVRCVSGVGQPNTLHLLTPSFPSLLSSLATSLPHKRLADVLTSSAAFALPNPATGGDSSAVAQVRGLEAHFGRLSEEFKLDEGGEAEGEEGGGKSEKTKTAPHLLQPPGRALLTSLTGARPSPRSGAAQLLKLREADERERREGRLKRGVLCGGEGDGEGGRTGRVVLESGLWAGVFLGRLPPADAADACSTGLFNPVTQDWEDSILEYVMVGDAAAGGGDGEGAKRLREMLGEVEADGGRALGIISPYFVKRFGFSPDCLIAPFSGPSPSTFLSFPLFSSPSPFSSSALSPADQIEWRDVLLSLPPSSGAETDELLLPCEKFVPAADEGGGGVGAASGDAGRGVWCNPARGWWEAMADGSEGEDEEGGGETARFVASVSSRDNGVGRALVRDLYANSDWKIFGHLSAIVPHGGTIGLDDKYFSFFFPHGEASVAQGLTRFVAGARVQEFPDRKANPRLLLESQFMSLRLSVSHIYRSLTPTLSTLDDPPIRPFDSLGFPALSPYVLPTRLILVGAAAQNPAISSLASTVFNAPVFLPTEGGLRSFAKSAPGEDDDNEDDGRKGGAVEKLKTTASALGAAYKAAWAYRRATGGDSDSDAGEELISFQRFLREGIEALAALQEGEAPIKGGGGGEGEEEEEEYSLPSGTQYSSPSTAGTRSTAPTYLSLPRGSVSGSTGSSSFAGRSVVGGGGGGLSSSSAPPSVYRSSPLAASTAPSSVVHHRAEHHHHSQPQQQQSPEAAATEELEPDPPGLTLVAMPDKDEWKYYSSMLPEFARIEKWALKGLI
ncbi:hypothetical protein JCM6882_004720 [Rhodosporidiobolus microsporus]